MVVADFIEQLLNGITLGMVYVLVAAGLSVIFGVMDVINFSHGELFALGAYFALSIVNPLGPGVGFWVALIVAPLIVGVIGAAIERTTVRPLYGRNPLYHILLTFGLVLIISDLIELGWGTDRQQLAVPAYLSQPVEFFSIQLSVYNYFIIVFGALLAAATWYLLNRTKYGMIIRAGSQDREMVRNVGIDIDRYYTLVFGVGAALAAVAGVVLGGYQNVNTTMGNGVIITAFVIVVLGGLGSFRGAVFGGLLVGVVQTLMRTYSGTELFEVGGVGLSIPNLEGLTVFLLMIGVLLLKPQGLFGTRGEESEGGEGDILVGGHGGFLSDSTRTKLGVVLVALLVLAPFAALFLGNRYYIVLLNEIVIWALFALSLDIVMGYAGLVPLGHTMFYGVGAYAAALVTLHYTQSIVVSLFVAVVICAVLAWIVGSLSIRVSGVYFAMITLAFAELFYNAVVKFEFTGGSDGLLLREAPFIGIAGIGAELGDIEFMILGLELEQMTVFYYLALALTILSFLFARRLMNAPFGSVLQSIRESEDRAEFIGYDTIKYKRRAFVVSGGMAGLAGGLLAASPITFIISRDQTLAWIHSGEVIVMALLGGMGTLFGPMLGAGAFIGAEEILSGYTEQWQLVIGTIFVLFVLFVPRGLVSVPSLLNQRFRQSHEEETPIGPDETEVKSDD
ncbi:ABC transporter permease [Natronoarchaeum mannanilyticum]|uniref:ABC transporter permease n=1 Tax=Natronoarchaeum mannanilyticum TaxID=926360 RepID=A0AAV3TGY8_9EURY